MRVLLTNHAPFRGSDSGAIMYSLAEHLIEQGHDVYCLIVDVQREGDEPFPVHRLVCNPDDPDADLNMNLPSFTSVPDSHRTFRELDDRQIADYREAMRKAIDSVVDEFDPSVIHCQHIWAQGTLVLETGVPYVLSSRSTNLMAYKEDPRYRLWADQAAENAGRILANSFWMANELCQLFDIEPSKVATVRLGVDVDRYNGPQPAASDVLKPLGIPVDGPLVVFSGKLLDFQGVDVLLAAAKEYESQIPGVTSVIAGDGPSSAALQKQASELGLERAHFVGEQSHQDLIRLYQLADLMVFPSRVDPFEIVYLEAFACGTPVVSCRVGAMAEIINEEIGGFVPPDDPQALAAMIGQALNDDWKSSKGPLARLYAEEQHSMSNWVSQVIQVYETVLNERMI